MPQTDDADDDALLEQIADFGAAANVARNPDVDPQIQALAQATAEKAAAALSDQRKSNP